MGERCKYGGSDSGGGALLLLGLSDRIPGGRGCHGGYVNDKENRRNVYGDDDNECDDDDDDDGLVVSSLSSLHGDFCRCEYDSNLGCPCAFVPTLMTRTRKSLDAPLSPGPCLPVPLCYDKVWKVETADILLSRLALFSLDQRLDALDSFEHTVDDVKITVVLRNSSLDLLNMPY